jgi:tetraacyldisaccharide 4'-kinase
MQLDRDVDVVIVGREDVERPRTLPSGHLREPLDVLVAADAIVTADEDVRIDTRGTDTRVFAVRRQIAAPPELVRGAPSLAIAGIAAPDRFFNDLRASGWNITASMSFRDHHRYSHRDLERIRCHARAAQAQRIVTTEKDYVRLLPFRPFTVPVTPVPLTIEPDPLPEFTRWLADSLRDARDILG